MKSQYNICVLPGDGIGPEVVAEAVKVLESISKKHGYKFDFQTELMGAVAIDATGTPLPEKTLQACLAADAVLLGAIGHPRFDNDPTAKIRPEQGLLALRKGLGLYANIRPLTAYKALLHQSPLKESIIDGVDILIYRELTGGIYFGEKGYRDNGETAYDNCIYSRFEIERIAQRAFQAAEKRSKKLTLVDKANVLETSRLWRKVVTEMSSQYPTVKMDTLFVDNAAMQLILNPKQFDVIVTENMFGDILSDEASVIAGSLGLLPSASLGDKSALFEPVHGSYPQAAGKGIANPLATILSAAMMLDHLGLDLAAKEIRSAVDQSIQKGFSTGDLSPKEAFSTSEVGTYIANYITNGAEESVSTRNRWIGLSTII